MQNYNVDEIVISDDCSTDDTLAIVKEFKDRHRNVNISILKNSTNLGYSENWNRCLGIATSDYVLLLHADDLLKAGTVEILIEFFRRHPECALVGGQEEFINKDNELISDARIKQDIIYEKGYVYEFVLDTSSYIPCSSVMFNMQKIRQTGFFDTDVLATDELM
jgi:glycosyltransferase involved in cell wall biosynthesis